MHRERSPEAIDTRLVLQIYAGVALTGGALTYAWPALFVPQAAFPAATPEAPWALARSVAALVIGAGACAVMLAGIAEARSRARALLAFGVAHAVTGTLFVMQWIAILEPLLPASVGLAPLVIGAVLIYIAATHESDTGEPLAQSLRSQYEEQLEEAARQEERVRLARDLHDAVKQQLFAIQTSAAAVDARFESDPPGARAALQQVRGAAREATTEMETLIEQLQTAPLETSGLRDALTRQCEALGFRTGAEVTLDVGTLPPDMWLPPGAQRNLFRGAQEALANIGRHARASRVSVTLGVAGDQLELAVQDDGAGFDTASARRGMGLENMRERARAMGGTFLLTTAPGQGTTARFLVPLRHQTMRHYAFRGLMWTAVLLATVASWVSGNATGAAFSAIAMVAVLRYVIAMLRLRKAGAAWH